TGLRHMLYSWLLFAGEGIWFALSMMLMLLVLLMLLRRRWAAVLGVWLILTAGALGGPAPLVEFVMTGAAAAIVIFLLTRFGILPAAIAYFTFNIIRAAPLTLDPSAWYFSRSVICLILLAAMMGYGFVASLGNKPAFRVPMLDD
ncbi:MAG TPA: hypothetical protein VM557_01050, partial [Thermoanaerobaculia bacterium]|nr:hypothetical protein [Thermoanaerobaculia bacterium]